MIQARSFRWLPRRCSPRAGVAIDAYRVDDFALSPVASLGQPATGSPTLMLLGYFYQSYPAKTLTVQLTIFR